MLKFAVLIFLMLLSCSLLTRGLHTLDLVCACGSKTCLTYKNGNKICLAQQSKINLDSLTATVSLEL